MSKAKIIIAVGLVGLAAIIVTGLLRQDDKDPQASAIPPFSSVEQARELSQGAKPVCLPDNQEAVGAVYKDDSFADEEMQWSNFEMTASSGLMDVPAGTNYELTINNYDGETATGTIDYDQDYGTYNYIIEKGPEEGKWTFVSMTACEYAL